MKPDATKHTIITGEQYGTKISVEIPYSDTDIDELFDAFETISVGLGYHQTTWREWVLDRASEYMDEMIENGEVMVDDYPNLRHSKPSVGDEFDDTILQSDRDKETFFNAITNPPQPTEATMNAIVDYVNKLNVSDDGWDEEMEKRYWEEQPPEPFATPEEVERYNIDGEFDDYGQRKSKEQVKVGRRGVKKK